jgi:hypothetical protein
MTGAHGAEHAGPASILRRALRLNVAGMFSICGQKRS